jgi:hypothetical protein
MKLRLLFIFLLFAGAANCQDLQISPAGQKLKDFYLSMDVENYWLAKTHVNWETGVPDMPDAEHGNKTHCSAFIAAACERLNIYILRPPQHSQILLANAQTDWLSTAAALNDGWGKLPDNDTLFTNAQRLADVGKVVVAVYKNTDRSKPGHAALVMPSNRSAQQLTDEGPMLIMAGTHNFNYITLIKGFKSHITSWPTHEVQFFVHEGGKLGQ